MLLTCSYILFNGNFYSSNFFMNMQAPNLKKILVMNTSFETWFTDIIKSSDAIMKEAYSKMTLDSQHKWHKQTKNEITQILSILQQHNFDPSKPFSCLDVGCGTGRHLICLKEQFPQSEKFIGMDSLQKYIDVASSNSKHLSGIEFKAQDCRKMDTSETQFDLVF